MPSPTLLPDERKLLAETWHTRAGGVCSLCDEPWPCDMRRALTTIDALEQDKARALAANERDRTAYAAMVQSLNKWMGRWSWLTEGRGPYEWDDERYQKEFAEAVGEMGRIARRFERNAHVRDHSDCPTTQADVDAARQQEAPQ